MEKSHLTTEMPDPFTQETAEQNREAVAKFMGEIAERNREAVAKLMQEIAKQNQQALIEFTKGLSAHTDVSTLIENHTKELQVISKHCIEKLKQDIEIERYRHMPWEQFLDLTYGSLADDPIEWDRSFRTDARDEIE